MNRLPRFLVLGALAVSVGSLAGCRNSDEGDNKSEDTKAVNTTEEKKAAKQKPPVDEGIDVPTEEDFEDSVSAQITDTSDLQKELDQLEKEIGK